MSDAREAKSNGIFPVPVADLTKQLIDGYIPSEPVELTWTNWRGDDKRYPLVDAPGE